METMMKPFNLEEAKAGKPVCTRDGRKVRILCTDLAETIFPIVAAVTCDNGREDIFRHKTCGSHYLSGTSSVDLFMVADKHEGWVNIYRIGNGVTPGKSDMTTPINHKNAVFLALLIVLNLVPVYGVFYWDWKSFDLIFLYWLEVS